MPTYSPEIIDKLNALRDSFAQQLPERVNKIHDLWETQTIDDWNWESIRTLHHLTHTLAGSGPTFGFQELGEKSRTAEQALKAVIETDVIPAQDTYKKIDELLGQITLSGVKQGTESLATDTVTQDDLAPRDDSLIYILDEKGLFSNELVIPLQQFDYRAELFTDRESLKQAMHQTVPATLIADMSGASTTLLDTLGIEKRDDSENGLFPVIYVSENDDIETRLQSVRNGAGAFVSFPFDPSEVIDKLDHLIGQRNQEKSRILILDDDEDLATHYQILLQQAGMDAFAISRPSDILMALADTRPDLIVMDIYMDGCTGIELAKVIRQHDAYLSIPIVYLSSESDLDRQLAAMRNGGDDFFTKPVSDRHLVSSISIRAERARILNNLMIKDSLTGLLKHTKIKEQLNIEFSRAHRGEKPLSFAMVDIDHFKSINDNYGHITGDRVIKGLSRLLQQRLRKSDSIGRYGGEEFAVVLPNSGEESAISLLNELRESFSQIVFTSEGKQFSATVSVGIASTKYHDSPEAINLAADDALYYAKNNGRNRVAINRGKDKNS